MTFEERKKEADKDSMLALCKEQGYVPDGCVLQGVIVYGLTNKGEDPCKGCNENRVNCGGRPNNGHEAIL